MLPLPVLLIAPVPLRLSVPIARSRPTASQLLTLSVPPLTFAVELEKLLPLPTQNSLVPVLNCAASCRTNNAVPTLPIPTAELLLTFTVPSAPHYSSCRTRRSSIQ